jgi:hypothetical protein
LLVREHVARGTAVFNGVHLGHTADGQEQGHPLRGR